MQELPSANERDAAAVRLNEQWVGDNKFRKQLFRMIEDPGKAAELLQKWPELGK